MFAIASSSIDRAGMLEQLEDVTAGGLVVFEGWVRDHNEGKKVASLEYQIYEALARKEGERILAEARERFLIKNVVCVHRQGHLCLGEMAVFVGAVAAHRDAAFQATRYVIDQVKLRLPIWKKEHYVNQTHEWVYCRDHHTHVHFHEEDYYRKQTKIVEQARLREARVAVVGSGGLGCPVLMNLAAVGVGNITVVDFDRVEISNIHRQPLYLPSQVGERKAEIAQKRLSELNPFIKVRARTEYLHAGNALEILREHDLVLDCTDNLKTKFLMHDACFRLRKPLVTASVFQHQGQLRTFVPGGPAGCWRCQLAQTPDDSLVGNCNDFGVLGSTVGAIGSLQASEAIALLEVGMNASVAATIFYDVRALSQTKIRNQARAGCECCLGHRELERDACEILVGDLGPEYHILDIREQSDEVLLALRESQRKVAVACHRGVRSLRLVRELRREGFEQFYSIIGGASSLEERPQ